MTRFRNLMLFAAVAALATGLVACGGDDGGDESSRQVLNGATLKGVKSGNLDVTLNVQAEGDGGGDLDVELSGPFQGRENEQLPLFDMSATVSGTMDGEDVDFDGGLTLTRDGAFVSYAGDAYRVNQEIFDSLQARFGEAAQLPSEEGTGDNVDQACREKVEQLDVSDFMSDLSNEGTEEVGGVETTHVSGDLDVEKGVNALVGIATDSACRGQLGSTPVPPVDSIGEFRDAIQSAGVDLYVAEDGIIRRVSATVAVEPPESGSGPSSADLSIDVTLSDVNQAQVIRAPADAKPLDRLLRQLGVDTALLDALSGSGPGGLGALQGLGGSGLPGLGGAAPGDAVPGAADVPGVDSDAQQAYLECLRNATTPADLQACARQSSN